jgi:soluble lytic murein transglycosylase-like protein
MKRWEESASSLLLALGEYNAGRSRVIGWIRQNDGDREKAIAQSASARYVLSVREKYLEYLQTLFMEPVINEPVI